MVGCEVERPLWAVFGPKWPILEAIRAYVGGLGPESGPKFACIGSGSGPTLATLGAYVGGLGSGSGPKLAVLEPK